MPQDFRQKDLRGQSFRGQDLSGADFSGADLRGANFTNATLVGCQFSRSRSGLKSPWIMGFVVGGLAIAGLVYVGYGAAFLSSPVILSNSTSWQSDDPTLYQNVLIIALSLLLALIIFVIVAVLRGISGLVPYSITIAATVCFIAFWPGVSAFQLIAD